MYHATLSRRKSVFVAHSVEESQMELTVGDVGWSMLWVFEVVAI